MVDSHLAGDVLDVLDGALIGGPGAHLAGDVLDLLDGHLGGVVGDLGELAVVLFAVRGGEEAPCAAA
eukprot:5188179-Pyramimonas_sp.AAC.1